MKLTAPQVALAALVNNLQPVAHEQRAWPEAPGRVLAQSLLADRDSPALTVSAMDGYAVRMADLVSRTLAVAGEVSPGQAVPSLPAGRAMRIFTGAGVPHGTEAVVRREDCRETPEAITLQIDSETIEAGQNMRAQGENLRAGQTVIEPGGALQAPQIAAMTTFGITNPTLYRRVRLSVLATGDELLDPQATPQPWQLRDANGPALQAMFAHCPWIDWQGLHRSGDQPEALLATLEKQLAHSDAVLLTGGVSMGDHDRVPEIVQRVGGRILFHKLAIRPGKPLLGAVGPQGQAVLGLPGNPVSVMSTARRFATVALRRRAGFAQPDAPVPRVHLHEPDDRTLKLWWYRPVRLIDDGCAELLASKGSGDMVAAARSDGIVEIPPEMAGPGPWPFYPWMSCDV